MNPQEVYNGQPIVRQESSPEPSVGAVKSAEISETVVVGEGEASKSQPTGGPSISTPADTQLPQVATPVSSAQDDTTSDDSPFVAADDEVIEREWVQKAKQIVSKTKNDPHEQEKEVGKLQADYIKKRYGKDVSLVSD